MYNKVILLTKCFPYDITNAPAESYLVNELKYLANFARHVYILSFDAVPNAKLNIAIPQNVTVLKLSEGIIKRNINIFFKMIKEFFFTSHEGVEEKKQNNIIRNIYLAYFMGKSDYYYSKFCTQCNKCIEDKSDSILIYNFWLYTYARTALLIKKKLGEKVKVISRAHGYDLYTERNRMNYLPLRNYLLQNLDHIFPCSNHGYKYLTAHYPEFSNKIQTAYLGTKDLGRMKFDGHKGFKIISCSRVEPIKRVSLILEALQWLNSNSNSLQILWTHIGDGTQLKEIKKRAEKLKISNRITFLGMMSNECVMKFFQENSFDLFINVSESEGLPISIMEAASFGLPILATDVGGTSELVDKENGWLINSNISGEEVGKKILEICSMDPSLLSKIGNASRRKWKEKFSIEKNAQNMLKRIQNETENSDD